ncbi:MAG: molecular chaperone [Caulobacteraceae bacterium]|nr:fimbria/pilus periplasmic chaperone [Caulobacter sp.]RYF93609.1 MAG: molecular chaperone [Caulobacteraceae bacterium]
MGLLRKWTASLAVAGMLMVGASAVEAMTVQPVVVDLRMSGREMSAPIRVENNGPNPLPVEIRVVETDISPEGVKASDRKSEDLLVFPPQAIIPPGETQVFRLQYVGEPSSEKSKHYYVEVAQLPVELPEGQSAIQILYNFQVMVNVASITATPPKLTVESAEVAKNGEGKPVAAFTVANSGLNYGYISSGSLKITYKDTAGKEQSKTLSSTDIQQSIGFGMVGPGASRRFLTPLEAAEGSTVKVTLTMPRGK